MSRCPPAPVGKSTYIPRTIFFLKIVVKHLVLYSVLMSGLPSSAMDSGASWLGCSAYLSGFVLLLSRQYINYYWLVVVDNEGKFLL